MTFGMPQFQPEGYLAIPDTGQGPGVLVLHAWWGLNETIKGVCDRLAQEGFVAFAPDLYHGQMAETIAEAECLSAQAEVKPIKTDIAAAVDLLGQHTAPAPEVNACASGESASMPPLDEMWAALPWP